LFVHARKLLVEANRLDATKAGITVGQEQRPSIYAVLFAGPISPGVEWIAVVGAPRPPTSSGAAPGVAATVTDVLLEKIKFEEAAQRTKKSGGDGGGRSPGAAIG
jgi:hypothetical protein